MSRTLDRERKVIVDQVIAHIKKKKFSAKQETLLKGFASRYFASVALSELQQRRVEDLAGALLSHWSIIYQRTKKNEALNIYNPGRKNHPWQSTHTVIDIVHEDMPFLVDSVRMEVNRQGYHTHFVVNLGYVKVRRDAKGVMTRMFPINSVEGGTNIEAYLHIEFDKQTDAAMLKELREGILRVLSDVRRAVEDWRAIQQELWRALTELEATDFSGDADVEESKVFLSWLQNNFIFLGCRRYETKGAGDRRALHLAAGSGLGVLRDESASVTARRYADLPPEARRLALSKQVVTISKTNTRSTVHRNAYTDYIGVKRFDSKGKIIGEWRFIGLYTSDAYNNDPTDIPLVRRKVATIIKKANLPPSGYAVHKLLHVLKNLPRDDLFQASVKELYEIASRVMHLDEQRKITFFARKDPFGRFLSCLVYVPRENFTTDLLERIQEILYRAFNAIEVMVTPHFSESTLASLHYVVRVDSKKRLQYDLKKIESDLIDAAYSWKSGLHDAIFEQFDEEEGNRIISKYIKAFPESYKELFKPAAAINDIRRIDQLTTPDSLETCFYRRHDNFGDTIHFKLFRMEQTVTLSEALPMLENIGLRVLGEEPHELILRGGVCAWINDFSLDHPQRELFEDAEVQDNFRDAFYQIWHGVAENDGFNRLILIAQLNWKQVSMLRAYARYLWQVGFTFSQDYIQNALINNPAVARLLVDLFEVRFNPDLSMAARSKRSEAFIDQLNNAFEQVESLDEDRILRRYLDVLMATLRTNYYQRDEAGNPSAYLCLKMDSKKIPEMPLPVPAYDLFVYSPRFEGIHLRMGKVARGGLRWSDRREDFRTEVLGLMKAQQVKNSLIVPCGAKGGFVLKGLPANATPEETRAEGVRCYQDFIRGLLDVTDNRVKGKVVPPKNTVRYDSDDPYMVVAADKGTATFSDIANQISEDYNFWLGDAFASGGSTGYDHKKMGITARGAWESVISHFADLNINPDKDDFTVVGVGDMGGDVFGNGMLLSKHIKLVGAFNHLHIFIDPAPNALESYKERKRLFGLPRSTWMDYEKKLISRGGGVFSRRAKSIILSPQAKKMLGITCEILTPDELIRHIIRAPVDLFWNGGIGTYVKGETESHACVGDRANDNLRVDGRELQCRVVGEGGNLGLTQLARVGFAKKGGRVNTDFVDNSAGVDCSDHEVNIKVLLDCVVASGELTVARRNQFLAKMQDEVAELVLTNNRTQNLALGLGFVEIPQFIKLYSHYINAQEQLGNLNRELESLPSNQTLKERRAESIGLYRPEISVLLAYSKNLLRDEILATDLPEDPCLAQCIETAFPKVLVKRYGHHLSKHHLRREIVAMQLSNAVVTDMGISFVHQMYDETGAPISSIIRAYAVARKVFDMEAMWAQIMLLGGKVSAEAKFDVMLHVTRLVRRAVRWFLRNYPCDLNIESTTAKFEPPVRRLFKQLPKLLLGTAKEDTQARAAAMIKQGFPEELAERIACLKSIFSSLSIIEAAEQSHMTVHKVATVYFTLDDRLGMVWLREQINSFPVDHRWNILGRAIFKGDLDLQLRMLTVSVLKMKSNAKTTVAMVDAWFERYADFVTRWEIMLSELRAHATIEFSMLSVAIRELFEFAEVIVENKKTRKVK